MHKEECPDQGWTPGELDHRGLDNREVKPYRCFCSPAELCSLRGSGGERGRGVKTSPTVESAVKFKDAVAQGDQPSRP